METPVVERVDSQPKPSETKPSAEVLKDITVKAETVAETYDLPSEEISNQEIMQLDKKDYSKFLFLLLKTRNPMLVASKLDVIAERYRQDVPVSRQEDEEESFRAGMLSHTIGEQTRFMLTELRGEDEIIVDPKILNTFYSFAFSSDHHLRWHASQWIDELVWIDNHNPEKNRVRMVDQVKADIVQRLLLVDEGDNKEIADDIITTAWASFPGILPPLLIRTLELAQDPHVIKNAIQIFGNKFGIEKIRKTLREYAKDHPQFSGKLGKIDESLEIEKGEESYADLRELYNKINFSEYKPNEQLNAEETTLLTEEFEPGQKIVDIAAGTGRLTQSLQEQGRSIVAFDFVDKHARQIKNLDSEAEVLKASWHQMPFKQDSIDGAYCLGRSFLHNTTVDDALAFLKESRRVLKDGGKLIIDLPDPDKGIYKKAREEFNEKMKKAGIRFYESGTIHDSPNGFDYFDRLAPNPEQFKAMALLAGFEAEMITERDYVDSEGNSNANMYWRLTKSKRDLTNQEYGEASYKTRTSGPPLKLSFY